MAGFVQPSVLRSSGGDPKCVTATVCLEFVCACVCVCGQQFVPSVAAQHISASSALLG